MNKKNCLINGMKWELMSQVRSTKFICIKFLYIKRQHAHLTYQSKVNLISSRQIDFDLSFIGNASLCISKYLFYCYFVSSYCTNIESLLRDYCIILHIPVH